MSQPGYDRQTYQPHVVSERQYADTASTNRPMFQPASTLAFCLSVA